MENPIRWLLVANAPASQNENVRVSIRYWVWACFWSAALRIQTRVSDRQACGIEDDLGGCGQGLHQLRRSQGSHAHLGRSVRLRQPGRHLRHRRPSQRGCRGQLGGLYRWRPQGHGHRRGRVGRGGRPARCRCAFIRPK